MKLSPAQISFLRQFPEDLVLSDRTIPGTLYPHGWKKNTSIATAEALWRQGFVEHSYISLYSCPLRLTEKGKVFLKRCPLPGKESKEATDDLS